jgi:hypothetical protein
MENENVCYTSACFFRINSFHLQALFETFVSVILLHDRAVCLVLVSLPSPSCYFLLQIYRLPLCLLIQSNVPSAVLHDL